MGNGDEGGGGRERGYRGVSKYESIRCEYTRECGGVLDFGKEGG